MKKFLMMFLILVGMGIAADRTVNPAGGADYTTISAAYAAASSGDVILLQAGTYDDDTQVWSQTLAAKNITIKPAASTGTVTLTRTSEGGTSWFSITSELSGFTTRFERIVFAEGKSGGLIFFWWANGEDSYGGNIECDGCTFTCASNARIASSIKSFASETSRTKRLRLTNCTGTGISTADSRLIMLTSFTSVYIADCSFIDSATALTTGAMIYMDSTTGPVHILDSVLTSERAIYCTAFSDTRAELTVKGCAITNTDTIESGFGIWMDTTAATATVAGARIIGNTITGYRGAIYDYAKETFVAGNNIYNCIDCINSYGSSKAVYVNNRLVSIDGTATGRCLMLGRKELAPETAKSASNTFTATTFVSNAAWDLSKVQTDKTCMAIAYDVQGVSPVPDYWGIVTGADNDTDTVTVLCWRKFADASVETPAAGTTPTAANLYVAVVQYANQIYAAYNIMDGSDATNVFTYDFNPRVGLFSDYNIYYPVKHNLGGVAQTTLAALQAKWQSFPTANEVTYYNDTYSKVQDPGSSTGLYLDMNGDSVRDWVGIPQSSGDYPAASDVRDGVSYQNGDSEGTLSVSGEADWPDESNVKSGVTYDNGNKTGTAVIGEGSDRLTRGRL